MVLTKADLINALLHDGDVFFKHDVTQLVECFFEEISNALEKGEEVKLTGFGNFVIRSKKERPGRNPKTGETIPVKARRVVTFHASQKLKERLEQDKSRNFL